MKVTSLNINKFRHLENLQLPIGHRVTIIAGQNGTGKTSLLGLIGHVFNFSNRINKTYLTLDDKHFETKFSDIFSFSYPKYDHPRDHDYTVELDDGKKISVLSYERKGQNKQTLRLRVGKSERGSGKIQLPVIYLGLRRLFPLTQEEKIKKDLTRSLGESEIIEYQNLHNEILLLDEKIKPQYIKGFSKSFYGVETELYDSIGSSAGQDNVGQILTAILSFQRLKNILGDSYKGGVLLIDELDATLYPAAQIKLLTKLYRWSQDLNLQIIFTTHSVDVISKALDQQHKKDSQVIFLSQSSGKIKNVSSQVTIVDIINDLRVLPPSIETLNKITVFCEDEEALLWLKNLIGPQLTKRVQVYKESFGGSHLATLANKNIPIFKKSIFVLDGDQVKASQNNKCPRIILLPGDVSPERLFFSYLKSLPKDDKFWGQTGGYTNQVCFRDLQKISTDRTIMKKWMISQKKYLGRGYGKLFNRWKKDNSELVLDFRNKFEEILIKITSSDS